METHPWSTGGSPSRRFCWVSTLTLRLSPLVQVSGEKSATGGRKVCVTPVHPSVALSSSGSKLVLHASDLPIAAEVLTACAERVPTDYLTCTCTSCRWHLHGTSPCASNNPNLISSHFRSSGANETSCCDLQMTLLRCAQVGACAAAGCRRGWRGEAVGHRGLEPAGARLRRHHLPGRRDAARSHHRTQLQGRLRIKCRMSAACPHGLAQQLRPPHSVAHIGRESALLCTVSSDCNWIVERTFDAGAGIPAGVVLAACVSECGSAHWRDPGRHLWLQAADGQLRERQHLQRAQGELLC